MTRTKSEQRRAAPAHTTKAPRLRAGVHADAIAEWKAWHVGGWASLWTEVQANEAKELLWLVDALHKSEDVKERIRLTAVVRAGRKALGLVGPAPVLVTTDDAQPAPQVVKRRDPRQQTAA